MLRWGKWLRALATIAGLWWGLSGIFLFPTDSVPHRLLLALVLGGAALAHVRMHAAVLECSAFRSILILLPLGARLIYEGKQTDLLAGLVLTAFTVGLVILAYRMNKAIVESVRLSLEKNSLIKDLESEITVRTSAEQALREARDHLEKRVEERTQALRESEQRFRALSRGSPIWHGGNQARRDLCSTSIRNSEKCLATLSKMCPVEENGSGRRFLIRNTDTT